MSIFKRNTKKTAEATAEVTEVKAAEVKPKKTAAKKTTKKVAEPKSIPTKMVSAFTARTLLVPVTASRVAVGQAFRDMYKVTPTRVNIIRVHGKEHRFGGTMSRQSDWKKALVTVKKGTRIDIFEKI